jgi:hypothetical protein
MDTLKSVKRVIRWIEQAERGSTPHTGSYINGGRAKELQWMKHTLETAPTIKLQEQLLEHWTITGALPRNILRREE